LTGITNVQIARYEKNTAQPTMMVLRKLSKALDVEFEEMTINRMKQLPTDDILVIKEVMDRFIESRNVRAVVLK